MADTHISINITGKTADITKKLNQVNANLSTMGSKAGATRARMAGLGNTFTGVMGKASALSAGFLGIAAAIRAVSGTIKTLANFGFEMSKVEAISGATGNTLKEMSALARHMGATTMYTATEAASAMKFLSMAGFNAKESMAALPATLDLAQAGTIELGRAADIASNIMAAYSIETKNTNVVVDDMVSIVNNANTNVQQLGDAMKYVGAAAAASGVTIPTTAAAIGVLSNAGMQGAMAGTGLRQVFIRLTNVTGASEDALKGMGLQLDQVNPQMVGLTAAITRLKEAGMTGGEAIQIFGARGAVAALNLAKGLGKYHDLKDIMEENEGIANKTAKTMQNNLMGAFKLMKSAVQEAILAWGDEGFGGGLKDFVNTMTELVRILSGTGDPMSKFHDKAQMIAIQVRRVVTAAKVFFHVWAATKIYALVAALSRMATVLAVGLVKGIQAAILAVSSLGGAITRLKMIWASTGVGALILGLTALVMWLTKTEDKATAATAAFKRMAEQRQKWYKEKTTFSEDRAKGESKGGGDIKGVLDSGDLKKVDDMGSVAELGNQLAIAKKIKANAEEMNKLAIDTAHKINDPEAVVYTEDIKKIMAAAGMEGEASFENFQVAQRKVFDEAKKGQAMVLFLSQKRTAQAVAANAAAKKHNALIKERLAWLKKVGEENNRAIASEENRAGKVALMDTRKGRMDSEINELEGKDELNDVEGRRLKVLKEQRDVIARQLEYERGMMFAERAGSKALEEQLELQKQLVDAKAEEAALRKRAQAQTVSEMAFTKGLGLEFTTGDNAPLDLLNQLDSFRKKTEELEGTSKNKASATLIGTNGFDLYGQAEGLMREIKRFGDEGDFNVSDEQAKWADDLYERLYDVYSITDEARAKIEKGAEGAYISRPMSQASVGGKVVTEKALLDTLVTAGKEVEAEMKTIGDKTAQGYVDRASANIDKSQPEWRKNLAMLWTQDKKDVNKKHFNLEGANIFDREAKDQAKAINKQLDDASAKVRGIEDDKAHNSRIIALGRQKELNVLNKIIDAENKSVDMQKRKLKLIGGKAAGQQFAEIEGKEKVADHMFKYEGALRKKAAMQAAERSGADPRAGDLTEEDIQQRLKEEKVIAAGVIAQELAKKGGDAKFGVSSLAQIGGGGGVGVGGDPLLNAADLANKLMEKAQDIRVEGVKKQNELVVAQNRTTAAIEKLSGNRIDPVTIV